MIDREKVTALRYLAPHEVASMLGKHEATIRRWAATGQFPKPYRLAGQSVGFAEREIVEWVRTRKTCEYRVA